MRLQRFFVRGPALLLICGGLCSCATGPQPRPADWPPSPPVAPLPAPSPAGRTGEIGDQQPVLVGSVIKVTDGDTIKVQLSSGAITVRLDSVDTPERGQPWGAEAQAALARRIDGQEVALDVVSQDQYDRLVAVVYLGNENINGWLVQQGHAWAYREYLKESDYCVWEGTARSGARGLWGLPWDSRSAPWEWRQVQRGNTRSYTDYSHETVEISRDSKQGIRAVHFSAESEVIRSSTWQRFGPA